MSDLLYSLSVSVLELLSLARVSPCQVMIAHAPDPMNMKVPIRFQVGWNNYRYLVFTKIPST